MVTVVVELILILACATALCGYAGWGIARLALPPSLVPFRAPLAPLIGYATLLWSGYMFASLTLSLRWALPLILAGATVLNMLAWKQGGPPRLFHWLRAQPEAAIAPVLALLAGVWPLLSYGYLTSIGQGWDTESYFPLAQHLIDYALPSIMNAPVNPLRDLVADPPAIGLTLGFSVFHGMVMLLSGAGALASFAPVIAFLRALGILAIYVWLRATMGLGRAGALIGATLAALGSLFLWIGYFNFGMQLSAWPLLALSLTVGLAAVEDLARRRLAAWTVALLAAIVLAAAPAAYYPALTILGPLVAAHGLARLIETIRRKESDITPVSLILAALTLGAVTAAAATLAIVDYFEGFSFRYSLIEPKIGPDRFIGLDEILGLTPFRLAGGGAMPPGALLVAAGISVALLIIVGIALPPKDAPDHQCAMPRVRWALALAATGAALLWLRFGRPYEYGFMKGAAYTAFLIWGAAALGIERMRTRLKRTGVFLAAAAAIMTLVCTAWSQTLIIAEHSRGPAIFTRGIATFEPVAATIPRGSTVLVSGAETLTGPIDGLLATMLYGNQIWGRIPAAYASQSYWPENMSPDYVVLAASEEPWPLAVGANELWRSDVVALYRMPLVEKYIPGRSEIHSHARVDKKSPAALAIWRRAGAYRAATPEQPLNLMLSGAGVARLTVATLESQEVELRRGGSVSTIVLDAGVSTIETAGADALQLAGTAPLALIDAIITPGTATEPATARADSSRIAWNAAANQRDDQLIISVNLANPGRHALRYEVTIIEDTFESPRRLGHFLAAAPLAGDWRLAFDLRRGASEARLNNQPTPLLSADITSDPPDGRFFGVLAIYSGEGVIARAPLFSLTTTSGGIASFEPTPLTVEAARAGFAEVLPGQQRELYQGAPLNVTDLDLALEHALLDWPAPPPGVTAQTPLTAGARLNIQLYWRAAAEPREPPTPPMISLQVVDSDNRKWAQWDGLLGGDWRPATIWQPGEAVRQDVPLELDPTAPPGDYRLLLVAYDPATGRPMPIAGQDVVELGELKIQ